MANTSPCHMPVLGNVHPIKIDEIYAIELLGSMITEETWRHLRMLHYYPEYIDLPGVCLQKCVMINWTLQYSSYGLSNIVNVTIL